MEGFQASMSSRGEDLSSSKQIRKRRAAPAPLAKASSQTVVLTRSDPSRPLPSRKKAKTITLKGDDGQSEEPDALNLLSQSATSGHSSVQSKEITRMHSQPTMETVSGGDETRDIDEKAHNQYPDQMTQTLRQLRFKKNKDTNTAGPGGRSSSVAINALDSKTASTNSKGMSGADPLWLKAGESSDPSSIKTQVNIRPCSGVRSQGSSQGSSSYFFVKGKKSKDIAKAQPFPVQLVQGVNSESDVDKIPKRPRQEGSLRLQSTGKPGAVATIVKRDKQDVIATKTSSGQLVRQQRDDLSKKQTSETEKGRLRAAEFPMSSPLSSPVSPSSSQPKAHYPNLSPLGFNGVSESSPKHLKMKSSHTRRSLSPLSQSTSFTTLKVPPNGQKAIAKTVNSSGHPSNGHKAKPFPMSTQTSHKTTTSRSLVKGRGKGFELEAARHSPRGKKRAREFDTHLAQEEEESYIEEDSMFLAPGTDPRTLCPFCDELLPLSPTPLLKQLLSENKRQSYPDPRPQNLLGRKAPVTVFINLCQRHRFESRLLPEAERKGWPKTIEWWSVRRRVRDMVDALRIIVEDDRIDDKVEQVSDSRGGCIFWKECMEEVRKQGSRVALGVQGQFANFEKAQPGYYGELGSSIILQTLMDVFPLAQFRPELVSPLTPKEFMQRVLVPEVGVRLIMEDKGLKGQKGKDMALKILRESTSYGVAMFPEGGNEWEDGHGIAKKDDAVAFGRAKGRGAGKGGKGIAASQTVIAFRPEDEEMGVADLIVLERARKRRKELEEEEQWEAESDGVNLASDDTILLEVSDTESRTRENRNAKSQLIAKSINLKEHAHITPLSTANIPQQRQLGRPQTIPVLKSSSAVSSIARSRQASPLPTASTRIKPQSRAEHGAKAWEVNANVIDLRSRSNTPSHTVANNDGTTLDSSEEDSPPRPPRPRAGSRAKYYGGSGRVRTGTPPLRRTKLHQSSLESLLTPTGKEKKNKSKGKAIGEKSKLNAVTDLCSTESEKEQETISDGKASVISIHSIGSTHTQSKKPSTNTTISPKQKMPKGTQTYALKYSRQVNQSQRSALTPSDSSDDEFSSSSSSSPLKSSDDEPPPFITLGTAATTTTPKAKLRDPSIEFTGMMMSGGGRGGAMDDNTPRPLKTRTVGGGSRFSGKASASTAEKLPPILLARERNRSEKEKRAVGRSKGPARSLAVQSPLHIPSTAKVGDKTPWSFTMADPITLELTDDGHNCTKIPGSNQGLAILPEPQVGTRRRAGAMTSATTSASLTTSMGQKTLDGKNQQLQQTRGSDINQNDSKITATIVKNDMPPARARASRSLPKRYGPEGWLLRDADSLSSLEG